MKIPRFIGGGSDAVFNEIELKTNSKLLFNSYYKCFNARQYHIVRRVQKK